MGSGGQVVGSVQMYVYDGLGGRVKVCKIVCVHMCIYVYICMYININTHIYSSCL